jgi:transmembrane sensor
VRAVGTAFNVRLADRAVEVIITEGRVAVAGGASVGASALPELVAGQRALVPLDATAAAPAVGLLAADELARRLAWQPRLLSFTDESLASILNEFNRHNPVTLRAESAALGELRLTARFRSDNVDGFSAPVGVRLRRAVDRGRARGNSAAGGQVAVAFTRVTVGGKSDGPR